MRALVLDDHLELRTEHPAPTPASDETLVRVLSAGVCETDLQLVKGYMAFRGVLGHEFVGVAETGPLAGRRVVGEINCSCWHCDTCTSGLSSHCPNRTVLGIVKHDGAFADYVAVPQRNLHTVPDTISNDEAVFVEPLAAAFQVLRQVAVRSSDRVVVLGDGRLGSLCAQVLSTVSSRVLLVGKHPEKLAITAAMGVSTALVSEIPSERWADIVVDCTGSETGLPTSLSLVRPRGTIVLKTTLAGTHTMAWSPVVVDEVTIVGSRCGPFDRALAALASGRVDVRPLVSARFDLSDGLAAMHAAADPAVVKVLLDISVS